MEVKVACTDRWVMAAKQRACAMQKIRAMDTKRRVLKEERTLRWSAPSLRLCTMWFVSMHTANKSRMSKSTCSNVPFVVLTTLIQREE